MSEVKDFAVKVHFSKLVTCPFFRYSVDSMNFCVSGNTLSAYCSANGIKEECGVWKAAPIRTDAAMEQELQHFHQDNGWRLGEKLHV